MLWVFCASTSEIFSPYSASINKGLQKRGEHGVHKHLALIDFLENIRTAQYVLSAMKPQYIMSQKATAC